MNRIVFTGDCLRSSAGESNQWDNINWLKNLVGGQLQALTGLSAEVSLPPPAECWRALGTGPSLENWSRYFWKDADDSLCEYLRPFFENSLVVAIELSPILESALDRLQIPWIEVGVSALRFLPDFALFFRFSSQLACPCGFQLSADDIQSSVAHVRAHYGVAPISGSVLFAQTAADRTLIGKDGFIDLPLHFNDLPQPLWVKPHPMALDSAVVREAVRRGALLLQHNTYAALSADVQVITIASSVALEARCFGRNPKIFNPLVLERNEKSITTLNGFRSSKFWREALVGFNLNDVDFDTPFIPNLFRSSLGFYGLDRDVYSMPPAGNSR